MAGKKIAVHAFLRDVRYFGEFLSRMTRWYLFHRRL